MSSVAPNSDRREVEVKIKLASAADFLERVGRFQLPTLYPRRLLTSWGYHRTGLHEPDRLKIYSLSLDTFDERDEAELAPLFGLLGEIVIVRMADKRRFMLPKGALPKRSVRLRHDAADGALWWTVKGPLAPGVRVKDLAECQVRVLKRPVIERVIELLGYELQAFREVYRTSWLFGATLVELNEAPGDLVWAEVEASSEEAVFQTVHALGYSEADTSALSMSDFLSEVHGLSPSQANNLHFAQSGNQRGEGAHLDQ